jgi:hypothetical protein
MQSRLRRLAKARAWIKGSLLACTFGFLAVSLWGDVPKWWQQRQVLAPETVADDFALLNQGQLKQFALGAFLEGEVGLPDGVSWEVRSLLDQWTYVDETGLRMPLVSETTDDYAPVNLGQLKAVAQVFYDQLIELGVKRAYPWTGGVPDDYALANLGQAKAVFDFDLRAVDASNDPNGSGLPDWWKIRYFGALEVDSTEDSDGDGMSNLEEFRSGTDPWDYYDGKEPEFSVVSGNGSTGQPGVIQGEPFVVLVTDQNGVALKNAPVTFSVTSSEGGLAGSLDASAITSTVTVRTDASGRASVYFQHPDQEGVQSVIRVGVAGKMAALGMTAKAQIALGVPILQAPTVDKIDGRSIVTLNWTPVSDATGYRVQRRLTGTNGEFQGFPGNEVEGTSLVDDSVEGGVSYDYIVHATRLDYRGKQGGSLVVNVPRIKFQLSIGYRFETSVSAADDWALDFEGRNPVYAAWNAIGNGFAAGLEASVFTVTAKPLSGDDVVTWLPISATTSYVNISGRGLLNPWVAIGANALSEDGGGQNANISDIEFGSAIRFDVFNLPRSGPHSISGPRYVYQSSQSYEKPGKWVIETFTTQWGQMSGGYFSFQEVPKEIGDKYLVFQEWISYPEQTTSFWYQGTLSSQGGKSGGAWGNGVFVSPDDGSILDSAMEARLVAVHALPVEVGFEKVGDNWDIDDNRGGYGPIDEMPGKGKRMFVDAKTPQETGFRDTVYVKVTGLLPGMKCRLKAFDVDDPTVDPKHIIDTTDVGSLVEKNLVERGNDNRGTDFDGNLEPPVFISTGDVTVDCVADAQGVAKLDNEGRALPMLRMTHNPGDNVRIAFIPLDSGGTDALDALNWLQVEDSNKRGYVPPSSAAVDGFQGVLSPMLTVWRKLNIEIDSMGKIATSGPEKNFDEGIVMSAVFTPSVTSGTTTVTVRNLLTGPTDRFQRGSLTVAGKSYEVLSNTDYRTNIFAGDKIVVNGSVSPSVKGKSFRIVDDDDHFLTELGLPAPLPRNQMHADDIAGIRSSFAPAYIDVVDANANAGWNPTERQIVPFKLYDPLTPTVLTVVNNKKDLVDRPEFWAHTVTFAYQGEVNLYGIKFDRDLDPDGAPLLAGTPKVPFVNWSSGYSGVFLEVIRDSAFLYLEMDSPERRAAKLSSPIQMEKIKNELRDLILGTMAHEIGHSPGGENEDENHEEEDLMRDGGSSINTPFSPASIRRFRGAVQWSR